MAISMGLFSAITIDTGLDADDSTGQCAAAITCASQSAVTYSVSLGSTSCDGLSQFSPIEDGLTSIESRLTSIESRLGILVPNTELEEEWDELRHLAAEYATLLSHIVEKQKLADILRQK